MIVYQRQSVHVKDEDGASGTRGTLLLGPLVLCGLERDDGFMRIPAGLWRVEMADMRSGGARALRFLTDGHREEDNTKDFWRSLFLGRLYVHPANYPAQLQGCIAPGMHEGPHGVWRSVDALAQIFDALGGWKKGERFDFRIMDAKGRTS